MLDCGRASRCLSPGRGMLDRFGGHRLTADTPFAARDFRNVDPSHAPAYFSPSIDAIASVKF